jgi:hypothetical protein
MSLSLVQSRALLGLDAAAVTVEVHLANGLPSFTMVKLCHFVEYGVNDTHVVTLAQAKKAAAARQTKSRVTRANSAVRWWTALTCIWKCQRSTPLT